MGIVYLLWNIHSSLLNFNGLTCPKDTGFCAQDLDSSLIPRFEKSSVNCGLMGWHWVCLGNWHDNETQSPSSVRETG
jgi:hypothetical protein